MPRLTFHGAAETVTGSKYLLETEGARVLIDCGLFQGLKQLRQLNWNRLPFEPASVDAVVLTHAHIDHIGYLPCFVKHGFRGPVYCTPATQDLAGILLLDAAKNQESDADYANRGHFTKHHPALPLFDSQDVARAVKLLVDVKREKWFSPAEPIWCRYHDAGHLLGSAMIEVEIRSSLRPLRVLFSGDVGRYGSPLYHDPTPPPQCDYLVCESTYGNRDHPQENVLDRLAEVVTAAVKRGGVMLVASFAVGRVQQLLYLLGVLHAAGRIPELPIYVDSPMAIDATNIYTHFAAEHDLVEARNVGGLGSLSGHNIHLTRTVDESKRINSVAGPAIIISSSGMMTGGRILHHLRQRLPHKENTIILGGFMAAGTRGRSLQEGARTLRIHGGDVPVLAAIVELSELSGHAGHSELLRWLEHLPRPRRVFLTHGEKESAVALAQELGRLHGWETVVPRLGESFDLELPVENPA